MKEFNILNRILITGFVIVCTSIPGYSQWPQWRGASRDGVYEKESLLTSWPSGGPQLKWSVNTVGDGFSSTIIENGMIFTEGKKDSVEILSAIDMNGKILWQKELGKAYTYDWPQSRSTPTYYQGKVYAYTVLGDLSCIDAKSGNLDWKVSVFKELGGNSNVPSVNGIAESPLIVDDKLLITPGGHETTMTALDPLTGKIIWKTKSVHDTTGFASPVLFTVNNKPVIFNSLMQKDILVDYKTGEIIWEGPAISGMVPVVYKNMIYHTGQWKKGGTLCKWDDNLKERSIVWADTLSANSIGGAVLYNNKLFVPGMTKGISCLDLNTGKILSTYYDIYNCTLLIADGMLYAYEDKTGKLCLFKINNDALELVSSFKISQGNGPRIAHLSIGNGLLFVRHGNVLLAFDIKS